MKEPELLDHLVDLARRLGFEVRTEPGAFRDGNCRLTGAQSATLERQLIILNRHSSTRHKVLALGRALAPCPLEAIYLPPAVRDAIENAQENSAAEYRRQKIE